MPLHRRDPHPTPIQLPAQSGAPTRAALADLRERGRLTSGAPWALAFLPDGRLLVGGGFGLTVHDPDTLAPLSERPCDLNVLRMVVLPGGDEVVVLGKRGAYRGAARVRLSDGRCHDLGACPTYHNGIAASPDGQRLYFGHDDGSVIVRDLNGARLDVFKHQEKGSMGFMGWVAASRDGALVAALDSSHIQVWTAQGEPVCAWSCRDAGIAFTAEGHLLVTHYSQTALYDPRTGEVLKTSPHGDVSTSTQVVSPDGRWAASGSLWGNAHVYFLPTFTQVAAIGGYVNESWSGFTHDVVALSDERLAVLSLRRGALGVWRLAALTTPLTTRGGYTWGIQDLSATDDLSRLVYTTADQLHAFEIDTAAATAQQIALSGTSSDVDAIAIAPDGQRIAAATGVFGHKRDLRLLDPALNVLEATTGRPGVRLIRWSPNSDTFATVETTNRYTITAPGDVVLRQPGRARSLKKIKTDPVVTGLAFSPRGDALALGWGQNLAIRALPKGTVSMSTTLSAPILALAIHPTLPLHVAASTGTALTLRGVASQATFEADALITALAFSPDGGLLFAGLDSGDLLVLDAVEATLLTTLRAHNDRITCLVCNARGLLSGSLDGSIRLFAV